MIFQKNQPRTFEPVPQDDFVPNTNAVEASDDIETVVGPSVNVEGDFASEGNIIVKGSVAGSVTTSRHLSVESGARILANVRAGTAKIAGEVKGNVKVREAIELASTARVVGDIEAKILVMEAGALILGRVVMPGLEAEAKNSRSPRSIKKVEEPEAPLA